MIYLSSYKRLCLKYFLIEMYFKLFTHEPNNIIYICHSIHQRMSIQYLWWCHVFVYFNNLFSKEASFWCFVNLKKRINLFFNLKLSSKCFCIDNVIIFNHYGFDFFKERQDRISVVSSWANQWVQLVEQYYFISAG